MPYIFIKNNLHPFYTFSIFDNLINLSIFKNRKTILKMQELNQNINLTNPNVFRIDKIRKSDKNLIDVFVDYHYFMQ